jgi:hypothetical protein
VRKDRFIVWSSNKCIYNNVCVNYGDCPEKHGDETEDYTCLEFEEEKER